MIYLNGLEIPYPNSYTFTDETHTSKHHVFTEKVKRTSTNKMILSSLGWEYLKKDEYNLILTQYKQQFISFQPLTFLFENAKIDQDMQIDAFVQIENASIKFNEVYTMSLKLTQHKPNGV